jgi:hypothetical protein
MKEGKVICGGKTGCNWLILCDNPCETAVVVMPWLTWLVAGL